MRQLALVALVAAAARASTVLRRDNRATFATTTLKFFGPQQFELNASGSPLVELRAAELAAIHAKGRAPPGIEGAVVYFDYDASPAASLEPIASRSSSCARRRLVVNRGTRPGVLYHFHDGSRGATPRTAACRWSRSSSPGRRRAELSRRRARGRAAARAVGQPVARDVAELGGCCCSALPALAGWSRRARDEQPAHHVRLGGRAVLWPPTKPVMVLATEAVSCPALAVVCLGGPGGSTDVWPIAVHGFFMTGLSGCGLFTTLVMAMHWRTESGGLLLRLRPGDPDPPARRRTRAAAAAAARAPPPATTGARARRGDRRGRPRHVQAREQCHSLLRGRSLSDPACSFAAMSAVSAIGALGAAYVLAQLCASVYFFHGAWAARRALRDGSSSPAGRRRQRARALLSVSLRRMSFWLAVSGPVHGRALRRRRLHVDAVPGRRSSIFFARCVMASGRFGSSLAQVCPPHRSRSQLSTTLSLSLSGEGGGFEAQTASRRSCRRPSARRRPPRRAAARARGSLESRSRRSRRTRCAAPSPRRARRSSGSSSATPAAAASAR